MSSTWELETSEYLADLADRVKSHEVYTSDVKTLEQLRGDIADLARLKLEVDDEQ